MDINKLTLDSIKKYYKVLRRTGSLDNKQVYSLIVLTFINRLFKDDYSWYITEKDYSLLSDILKCVSKNACVINYSGESIHIDPINLVNNMVHVVQKNTSYAYTNSINNYLEDTPIRVDEGDIIRLAKEDILRIANKL